MMNHRIERLRLSRRRDFVWLASSLFACFGMAIGCDLPRDPEGSLERARNGVLRVGVTPHGEWVESDGDKPPAGIEPALVEEFARQLGAEIRWYRGSESQVLRSLEKYELDLVVAGLTDDTLWSDRVALSQPYVETDSGRHVMAVAPGENRFLLQLDRFLKSREGTIAQQVRQSTPDSKVERP